MHCLCFRRRGVKISVLTQLSRSEGHGGVMEPTKGGTSVSIYIYYVYGSGRIVVYHMYILKSVLLKKVLG